MQPTISRRHIRDEISVVLWYIVPLILQREVNCSICCHYNGRGHLLAGTNELSPMVENTVYQKVKIVSEICVISSLNLLIIHRQVRL